MRAGNTLVAWKLDRLARSTKQLIETVEDLARREIGFRCLTQDIDTTTAGGRLVFTTFSAIAEFEREIIRERTCAGLDAARARGRRGGWPPALKPHDLKEPRALLSDRRSPWRKLQHSSRCHPPRYTVICRASAAQLPTHRPILLEPLPAFRLSDREAVRLGPLMAPPKPHRSNGLSEATTHLRAAP